MVAIDRAHLAGPGIGDAEIAASGTFDDLPRGIEELRDHAEERQRGGAGLEFGRAGERRDQNAAGLGLPPGIDNRAAAVADHAMIPLPRLRIDRLADGAQQPQRFAARFLHRLIARLHQRADRGRRGIEGVDLVLVDDIPEARHGRVIRHAFEHQRGGAVRKRPVNDVTVTRHPADIGGAPVNIALVIIEDILVRDRGVDQIAAGGVQHALRLAGRTRSIKNEQRIFRAHFLARAIGLHRFRDLVVINVASRFHVHCGTGAAHDDHRRDPAGFIGGGVRIGLERDLAAAAHALVGGDEHARFAVLDAAGERIGREAAEHYGMNGADARASEHGVGRFGNHREINGDAVALLDAALLQDVSEAAHFRVQFLIGDLLVVLGVVAFPDDGDLLAALLQVAVDAVVSRVGLAVLEPFDRNLAGAEGGVLHLLERLHPVDALRFLGPEFIRVLDRSGVHFLVVGVVEISALLPRGRDRIKLLRHRTPPSTRAVRAARAA